MEVVKILLKDIRFGYEHLFAASAAVAGAKEKFSVEIRIPKDRPEEVEKVASVMRELESQVKKKEKNKGKLPKDFETCFYDGDDSDKPGYEDCWYLSAKSLVQRPVFSLEKDENGQQKQLTQGQIKGGDWGHASISAYIFEEGKGGITFFLNSVMKTRDGEAISAGGGGSADEYNEFLEDTEIPDEENYG